MDWSTRSNILASEISGPNPESDERDDIQDQSALKKGIPASYWMLLSAHKRKVRE
jgi:hypothetical protein